MAKILCVFFNFIIIINLKSQCTAPSFTVNLSSKTDTTAIIANKTRGGVCCGSSNCVTFLVYANPGSELISFDVTNPSPSGSAFYQVNCGTPVSIGTPLCITGLSSPFTITYCKPGGDSPDYVIGAGTVVHASNDISIQKTGCVDTLFVTNVSLSSIVWTSIYPGAEGAYNSYLSCTSGCNSTLVKPSANPPAYVDFKVSGMPNTTCGSFTSDTVRVYFVPRITGTVTPATPVICAASGTTLTLTAIVNGGALPYRYDWSNVAGPNNSYTTSTNAAGVYTVVINDNTKCPALILTKTIGTIPVTTFSFSTANTCKNSINPIPVLIGAGQLGIFSATPAGLNFVSTSTGEVNLTTSNSGTYVITNTISPSGTCPGASSNSTLVIYPFPTMTSASTATICSGNSISIPYTSSLSSYYNWIGTDNVNTTGESVTTQTTSTLTNTIINLTNSLQVVNYTVTPISNLTGSCVGTAQTINVSVNPKDDAGFTYPSSTNCQTGINPIPTITGLSGGVFSSSSTSLSLSATNGTINLSGSSIGSYFVTYATNGTCPNSKSFPITITTAPSAAFSYTASPICKTSSNPFPTYASGASGGSFSVTPAGLVVNNLTGEINLATSTAGTYTVTNLIAAAAGCGLSVATATIKVTDLKTGAFSYTESPICKNATNPLPTFVGTGVAGLFSSASGLTINNSTGLINLALSTSGTYTVTNTIAAVGGCPSVTETNTITITTLPIASFNYSNTPYCQNGTNPLPSISAGSSSGIFSSSSVFLVINSTTGLINLANSNADNYIVVNTIAAANGCPDVVVSASVTITKLPIATILYNSPYCSNSSSSTPTLDVDGTNGIYNATPAGLTIDNNAGTIDISLSAPNNYTVTNTIAAANGCPQVSSSYPITISQLPNAIFNYSATPFCIDGTNPTPSFTGTAIPGTFSATAGISINASSGLVNLASSSAGTYTVTNFIAALNGCPDIVATNSITINPIATAFAGSNATICANQVQVLAGNVGGAASTLTWTTNGSGIFSNANSGASTYTPSVSDITLGKVVLTIKSNDPAGPCSFATNSMTLTINPTPTVSAGLTNTLTCTNTTLALSGSGAGSYVWTGAGILSGSNTPTPIINLPGTYSLVVTSIQGCLSGVSTVAINQSTVAPTVASSNTGSLNCTVLSVNANATTTTTPVSYNWSGTGITSATTISTITVNQGGTFNYTVTNTANNCATTGLQTIIQNTVVPVTTASSTGSITCITNTINLNSSLAGMNYTWTAPAGSFIESGNNSQQAIGNGLGTYTVFVINPLNNCYYLTTTTAIQNTTTSTGVSAGPSQTLICGATSVTLTGEASPSNSIVNWQGGICGNVTSFTTIACAPAIYTLNVAHPITGCIVTSTVSVSSSTDIPQATLNAITNSITCTNSLVTIGVTLLNSPTVSYSWQGAGVQGASDTPIISATIGGTYSVTITNTVTNCQSIYTAIVPTNTIPVIASIIPPSTITCVVLTTTLLANPDANNYTYTWTGSGIVSGETTSTPIINLGGDYSVAITNTINGCVGYSSVTVSSNTIIPVISNAVTTVTTNCSNPTTTFSISVAPVNDIQYTWLEPSTGTLNSTSISNPIASGSGIFTVIATNTVSGCTSSITQNTISVYLDNAIPSVSLSATSLSITCSVPTPSVMITTNMSSVSYSWTPTSGIVSGTENSATPLFNSPGSYSAIVINTVSGCSSVNNINTIDVVLNNTIPIINLSTGSNNGTLTCITNSIIVTPTINPIDDLVFNWNSNNSSGISSPTNQANAAFTGAGTFSLSVTNTVTGCSSIVDANSIFTVYVDTIKPTVTVAAISSNSVIGCGIGNSNVLLLSTNTSTNATVLNWLPSNINTSTISISSAGVYTIEVIDAINSCSATAQYTVNGGLTPPQNVNAGTTIFTACNISSVTLNGTTTSTNVSYSWTGPTANSIISGANSSTPDVNEQGIYTLTVTDNLTGCQSTATVNVLQTTVIASFSASPVSGTSPLLVDFTNQSTGATTYNWNLGDGTTSILENPNNTYPAGNYTVILTAINNSCSDTAMTVIQVIEQDSLSIEIPNVFTPNDDNVNDIFTVKSKGATELSIQIFNRWGEKLFDTTVGTNISWDGRTFSGIEVPVGTYFYFVKAKSNSGKLVEKHGSLSLFR